MRRYSQLLVLFLYSCAIIAQQNNHWYFGMGAALEFSGSGPSVIGSSNMNTIGGCSSISDVNGNLLFYTNGKRVWDNTHQLMPNGSGLLADTISHNSAVILQKPGGDSLYYIFSHDMNTTSLYYSVVDMTKNSGKGDITSTKNVLLYNLSDGILIPIRHGSCSSIWLITRRTNTNTFRTFTISNSGVSSTSIPSSIGTINMGYNLIGRASPDGTKIAVPVQTNSPTFGWGSIEVFQFNNLTGIISNVITIPNIRGGWSVEFSPNSNVLYGVSPGFFEDHIYQWNLSNYSQTAIINSEFKVDSTYNENHTDLQLGPDGKIYIAINGPTVSSNRKDSLSVINNPDFLGPSCNYDIASIYLTGRQCGRAFPRILASQPQIILINDSCENDTATLSLLVPSMYSTVAWNFGDPSSGTNNTSTSLSPKHKFTCPGAYSIQFLGLNGCFQLDTILDTIIIEPLPIYDLGLDTAICSGDTVLLNAASLESTYIWQDSTTDSMYYATMDTSYWVEVTNGCGSVYDTISITHRNFDNSDLGNDTSICPGDTLTLNATTPNASHYKWQNNSTDSILIVTNKGLYSVEIGNDCDTFYDSINVLVVSPPNINLGQDTMRCFVDSITLNGSLPGVGYLWYNGDTNQVITTNDTGIIWVEAYNSKCSAIDTIRISIYDSLSVNLGEDTIMCIGDTIGLSAFQNINHNVNYSWQDNSTKPTLTVTNKGTYWVNVSDYCMNVMDIIEIGEKDCTIGINRESKSIDVNIYPNPTKDVIEINSTDKIQSIHLHDITGRLLQSHTGLSESKYSLDLIDQNPAIYILRVETINQVYQERIVKVE